MKAIVYTSNTGHTAEYAGILSKQTGLPVYSLDRAVKELGKGTAIIYLGWLFANSVKGYQKAAKLFAVSAVCGVGLCDTGTLLDEVRKTIALPESIPLFTLQGGIDRSKLKGIHRFMIHMLTKGLSSQKKRSEQDAHMLALPTENANYVREAHTAAFMEWFRNQGEHHLSSWKNSGVSL